jgi:hypothetical protein
MYATCSGLRAGLIGTKTARRRGPKRSDHGFQAFLHEYANSRRSQNAEFDKCRRALSDALSKGFIVEA